MVKKQIKHNVVKRGREKNVLFTDNVIVRLVANK
jgi:hypothetical protein